MCPYQPLPLSANTMMHDSIPTQEDFLYLMDVISSDQNNNNNNGNTSDRKVRFAPLVTLSPASPLSEEEVKESWYSSTELGLFKRQARQLAREGLATSTLDSDRLRGLEHATPLRQKHRHMAIHCTLSAARRGMSPDQVGMVSRQCTRWNEELAFVQACMDYALVYRPSLVPCIPRVHQQPPAFPFPYKRTSAEVASASSRRVRRRTTLQ